VLTANSYSLSCLKGCAWVANSYSLKVEEEKRNIHYQFLRRMGSNLSHHGENRKGTGKLI